MEKDTVEKTIFVIGKTLRDYMQKKLIIYILALKLCTPDARLVKKKTQRLQCTLESKML